jgi:hypothetical protein
LQDVQQALAAHRGQTVAARGERCAAVALVDIVPAGELVPHRVEDRGVGMLDAAERLVGEHESEDEGVVRGVALPYGDLVPGVQLLGQRREVQAGGGATGYRDTHVADSLTSGAG